tara:strand:+ start:220 stop:783 length:564 start_codon:yes stop_codon:yes gene_type:complete
MKQQIKLYKIKGNPRNPRIIKNDKFKKLVKSIKDFPQMLEKRPIVVDEEMMVLGGNMRLKASKEAGLKEVWIDIAEGWTQEQKDEFVVKDNVNFGEWDWDMLGNEWDNAKLGDWGMDVWQPEEAVDYSALDDIDLGDTLQSKQDNVLRGIVIEFEVSMYDEANELIKKARESGKNVGQIVLNAFKNA